MKVALVHDWLTGMRGGEKVLEVFCELFPHAEIFTLFFFPEMISDKIKSHEIIVSNLQRLPLKRRFYRNYLPLFPSGVECFDLRDYDLVVSTSHAVAKGAIVNEDAVSICYCHTPMRYIYDLFSVYFPEADLSAFTRILLPWIRDYLRNWDEKSTHRVNHFIANSRNVAKRIKKLYNRESTVIYPPVDTSVYRPSEHGSEDYYLIVSALVRYKRIDLAINAFNLLGKKLLIIGSGPEEKYLKSLAKQNIEFLGRVEKDEDVNHYYQDCHALIFPGIEDFGLTPLECQSAGRPVIAFAQGGALESVIEGISGHFFIEQTVDAIVNAVYEFEEMLFDSETLRQRALEYDSSVMLRTLKNYFLRVVNQAF